MGKNHFSDTTIFLMIFTALLFDAIQAIIGWIPVFGNILADIFSLCVFGIFFIWFKTHGISMITPKRLKGIVAGGVVEMIPFLNILPAWTGVVVYLIGTTRIKELASKHPVLAKAGMATAEKVKNINKTDELPNVPFVDKREENPSSIEREKRAKKENSENKNQIYYSDALDELNKKRNPTPSDIKKLERAESIMRNHSISPQEMKDPIYLAAWNKVQAGIEAFDGTNSGYKFNKNTKIAA